MSVFKVRKQRVASFRPGGTFMCGISGIVNKDRKPAAPDLLRQMNMTLQHRGPDDEDLFIHEHVGLAFRRLSILDLTNGAQPIGNESKTVWLVFNGEIYNEPELRNRLQGRGHVFSSGMDGEVILHLYEEKGIQLLDDLRGMFVFALYDMTSDDFFLVRDHFGIKPVYYTDTPHQFAFSSEIKALIANRYVNPSVNANALWQYLSFQYVPDPSTMFNGIEALPPAHYLRLKAGQASMQRYWKPDFHVDEDKPLSYFTEAIADALRDSVHVHKRSDVPYGAFLSSGMDSSVIAALLQEEQTVDTFTVSFAGANPTMDESVFARETAGLLQTRHHEMRVTAANCMEELENMVYYHDQPVADPSAMGLYFLSQLASRHVTVVLSGEGADELFGGYPIYHEPKSLQLFNFLSPGLRQGLGKFAEMLPYGMKGRGFLARGSLPLERRFIGNAYIFRDDMKEQLVRSSLASLRSQGTFSVTDAIYEQYQHLDDITRMQLLDINTWLPGDILMKADKMTMAHSLELRVPFLDRKVFEVAASIPAKYRIANGTTKYVLRQAVADILPEAVQNRPKLGFPIPIREWIKNEMHDMVQDTLRSSSMNVYFHRAVIDELMSEHLSGRRDNARQIWTLFTFALWHQMYVENAGHLASRAGLATG